MPLPVIFRTWCLVLSATETCNAVAMNTFIPVGVLISATSFACSAQLCVLRLETVENTFVSIVFTDNSCSHGVRWVSRLVWSL